MKIYFASLGNDTYPFSNKVRQKKSDHFIFVL
jgi:hypothetical protein